MNIKEFIKGEEIGGGPLYTLFRAFRHGDSLRVLLKAIRAPEHREISIPRLQREFEIGRELDIEGLIRVLGMVERGTSTTLVLEDPGGLPLAHLLEGRPLALEAALSIANGIAKALSTLHQHGFTHLNILPRNIWFNPLTERVSLTGMEIASRAPRGLEEDLHPRIIEGALAYTSPEQTGRTARIVDYRTDFYAFGVILFEMLTGRLPFENSDPLELIHAHVAKQPVSPSQLLQAIPETISNIVLKLLQKPAERRYQSAQGIQSDLLRCLDDLQKHGKVPLFSLGQNDEPSRFELPQRLYGREAEMDLLNRILEEAGCGKPQLLKVFGPPGMGKTALVERLRRIVLLRGGHFARTKWDEFEYANPHNPMRQAVRDLVSQLLTEEEERLTVYRSRLEEALGVSLGVVVEAFPEVELITGKQPPPPKLAPTESKNRLHHCIQQFVKVLTLNSLFVVFYDDLQWVDSTSLSLVRGIYGKDMGNILLVCAYRSDSVQDDHPLLEVLDGMGEKGFTPTALRLGPLTPANVEQIVADTLRAEPVTIAPLADLIYRRTAGNPYFVKAFLASLWEEKLLRIVPGAGWTWNLEEIRNVREPDSVGELTDRRFDQLSKEARNVLAMAAALGHRVEVAALAVICEQTVEEVETHLIRACEERILIKQGPGYRFEHDQLQRRAYAAISVNTQPEIHLRIARLLQQNAAMPESPEQIFAIADHLNRGVCLLKTPEEHLEAARLNLAAGRKAKASAAFPAAFEYFSRGLFVLGANGWATDYDLSLSLHNGAVEAAFLVADFESAERLAGHIHDNASHVLDQITAYETQISVAYARRREADGLRLIIQVLKSLGVEIPQNPTREQAIAAIREIQHAVKQSAVTSHGKPRMTDPSKLAAMRLITRSIVAAGWLNSLLVMVFIGKLAELTLRYGQSPEACIAYVLTGNLLCSLLKDYDGGYEVGRYGLKLSESPGAVQLRSICLMIYHTMVGPWREHPESSITGLAEAHRIGIESGDLTTADTAAFGYCQLGLQSGMVLSELEHRIRGYHEDAMMHGIERIEAVLLRQHQTVTTFLGRSDETATLAEGARSMGETCHRLHESADHSTQQIVWFSEMMLHLVFRRHNAALEVALQATAMPMGSGKAGIPSDAYTCLCLLGRHTDGSKEIHKHCIEQVQILLARMKLRAESAPMNYGHKVDLIKAEYFRVLGKVKSAIPLYEKAIQGAREHRYVNEQALANELAAEFYLELSSPSIAAMYLKEAASAYRQWGAQAKLDQLYAQYPELLTEDLPRAASRPLQPTSEKIPPPDADALDMTSIRRAARALAGELDLGRLVRKLMKILLQNAAAQRGVLLREENGCVVFEACVSVEEDTVHPPFNVPVESSNTFSPAVVRYVSRTYEAVVLGDAGDDNRFAGDPYVKQEKPKSILCTPILHQGKLIAILYLENNCIRNAFIGNRLTAVQLICSQTAAALENARLHENLKKEIIIRRRAEEDLRRALKEVAELKDRFQAESVYLREEIKSTHDFEEIVGDSSALKIALHKIDMVSATDAAVLILGETGTGKELVARAVHARSPRKNHPLVKVNCAALPSTLIESELFGHEKGAFTGALTKRVGRFELAHNGTIFLDEIGDLPLDLQAKLLRVLQESEFERLGSAQTLKVNVRVIAATNRDLETESAKGRFRSDLYYRLSVFPIELPPVRNRAGDIPLLVSHFITKKQALHRKNIKMIPAETMEALQAYSWPGNVRELENIIERAIILSPGPTLIVDESLGGVRQPSLPTEATSQSLEDMERAHISRVVKDCGWKIKGVGNAADQLGMPPSTLQSRMKKLGIKRPS